MQKLSIKVQVISLTILSLLILAFITTTISVTKTKQALMDESYSQLTDMSTLYHTKNITF